MASLSEKKNTFKTGGASRASLSFSLNLWIMADAIYQKDPPVEPQAPPKETRTAVAVTSQTIDVASLSSFVADDAAGATSTFVGTTRDTFQGKRTLRLEYEAYAPMAMRAMQVTCLFVCGGLYKRRLAR